MATLIKTNGVITTVTPENQPYFTLEEMQGYVGGLIQLINISGNRLMICNEEGKIEGLPLNRYASYLAMKNGVLFEGDYIAGNILICHNDEVE